MRNFTIFLIFNIIILSQGISTGQTVSDADGNVYNTVVIGTQEWINENLHTTKLNDGTPIPLVSDNTEWVNLTTPGYCWYNNLASNDTSYGALYNWYTVNTNKLCPTGWAVPTDAEWTTLVDYLGGSTVAGDKLKEAGTAHWAINPTATNESGFTALPGGQRGAYGVFDVQRYCATFWSSTAVGGYNPGIWNLYYTSALVQNLNDGKDAGKSVRCIKGGTSSVQKIPSSSCKLILYPNPSESRVAVSYEKTNAVTLQVLDIFGKVVLEKQFTEYTEIELLSKGIYMVKIIDNSDIKTEKLIIQ